MLRLTLLLGLCPLAAAAQDYTMFQSPTGNIGCAIFADDPAMARCDLREFTASFTAQPADCDLDWGFAFGVGATGEGGPLCAGDTVLSQDAPVLDYGQTVSVGGITCLSEETGMTCTNAQGHGFSVARAAQQVF